MPAITVSHSIASRASDLGVFPIHTRGVRERQTYRQTDARVVFLGPAVYRIVQHKLPEQ